jgi:hypothetical protein
MTRGLRRAWPLLLAVGLLMGLLPAPAVAKKKTDGFLTPKGPYITLTGAGTVLPIMSVGETIDGFLLEGLPDGIGMTKGPGRNTVDVYLAHEQSTVPFRGNADFQDASVSKLTLDRTSGAVLSAEVAIPSSAGFIRFCSAFMAGRAEGFSKPTFFANEEANDLIAVPAGASYGPDPALAPSRQAGYAVALDTRNGKFTEIAGLGRLNHENTIVVPGGWRKTMALLTTDDTFSAPSSQLYLYLAKNDREVWRDQGHLWAFRVTAKNGFPVDPTDAFNGANDYLDLAAAGADFAGEFIPVPDHIADGTTGAAPQTDLEQWSNDNNVFQFIRLEDLATDVDNPRVVFLADTGADRVVPDPATGRMLRGPSGTVGQADNGSIFRMEFNRHDPTKVDSLRVLAQGDNSGGANFVGFHAPDNMDTSVNSLMVQEDFDNARIWRYDLSGGTWSVVATVADPDGESSGIVDASEWFGPGSWLLDVQAHGTFVVTDTTSVPGVTLKREDGQLLLMTIPGS